MAMVRHAMLVDQQTEQTIVPLNDSLNSDGKLELANSAYPSLFYCSSLR